MSSAPFHFSSGRVPLLISIPHVGTEIPPEIAATMTPAALQRADTDWHLDQLYDFAHAMGASVLAARYSRYVIDLNRPRDDANLYPGQNTTTLCPVDTFALEPLYHTGSEPHAAEIAQRIATYWTPYHAQLQAEITRLKAEHGSVLLWDAHSIRSRVPRFFEGDLPDLCFGTADGASCASEISEAVMRAARSQSAFSHVLNGRFKGGNITRAYGNPAQHVHAIQLEMTHRTYMNEASPFDYMPERAAAVRPVLQSLLSAALDALHTLQRVAP